jgi:hypothetical protein
MAHSNIEDRRRVVSDCLLDGNIDIDLLSKLFDCHQSAIRADIIVIKNGSGANVTSGMKKKIFLRDGKKCRYCGDEMADHYIIEHVVPASRGGKAVESNLVVSCAKCNSKKRYNNDEYAKKIR